jgi:hypothetical protein
MLSNSPKALSLSKIAVDAPEDAHPHVDLLAQAVLFEDSKKFERMRAFVDGRRSTQP